MNFIKVPCNTIGCNNQAILGAFDEMGIMSDCGCRNHTENLDLIDEVKPMSFADVTDIRLYLIELANN